MGLPTVSNKCRINKRALTIIWQGQRVRGATSVEVCLALVLASYQATKVQTAPQKDT